MKAIIGLGNPGLRYRHTRHNIGFMVVDKLAKACGVSLREKKYNALIGKAGIEGEAVLIAKPEVFVNRSGRTVRSLVDANPISLSDILLVCDDADLEFGRIRLRSKGGSGGHKGLASVIDALSSKEFSRLRVGIGRGRDSLREWVLKPLKRQERKELLLIAEKAREICETWVVQGIEYCMNKYNG